MKLLEQICMLDYSGTLPSTFLEVRQDFDAPRIRDISRRVRSALQEGRILNQMRKGDRVAVALGSRGIANIAEIAKSTIDCLRLAGLKPFVVPAMGSHGGARANGQKEVLSHLGITTDQTAHCISRQTGEWPCQNGSHWPGMSTGCFTNAQSWNSRLPEVPRPSCTNI